MEKELRIEYDLGGWTSLCCGILTCWIGEDKFVFPQGAMVSGGSCRFGTNPDGTENLGIEIIEKGDWSIDEYPEGFPEDYKDLLLEAINNEIDQGCCGQCF